MGSLPSETHSRTREVGSARCSGDNTNGLLEWSTKGTDLSIYSEKDLDQVAAERNDGPGKRLEFQKLIELIEKLLFQREPSHARALRIIRRQHQHHRALEHSGG